MTGGCDILIHVQHLLGIGHLKRATLIARALADRGLKVTLVSGGFPVPDLELGGAELVQLAPLRAADAGFSALVDADGRAIDPAWQTARRDRLLALFQARRPRVLVTELFPFGRRLLRVELIPLLEAAAAARPRPQVVSSVRDLLNPPYAAEKLAWMSDTFARYYDRLLVHGDPQVVPFERSFPPAAELGRRLTYTGYVSARARQPHPGPRPDGEVLVSCGGGAVAEPLIAAALAAYPLCALNDRPWHILVGANLPEARFAAAGAAAPPGVTVERARADFFELLSRCAVSVSQAGYNTMTDLLAAGPPAVVVPFATAGEREQSLRAEAFAAHRLVSVVDGPALTAAPLARAIEQAPSLWHDRRRSGPPVALDGAERSAEILVGMVGT